MKTLFKILFIVLIVIGTVSCSNTQKEPYKLPENAIKLLSGELGKNWKIAWRYNDGIRMNMRGCFLSYRITYRPDMTIKDNSEDHENCGPSLSGNWEIITNKKGKSYIKWVSDQLPQVMNIKKKYKFFKILKITEDTLQLQYRHKQFSSESIFIDTFVTEQIKIKDRDFHW
ncbi:lipocalin family protein [Aquimarina sp. 2304DJ70-9]|uniref:lipocalin family protein n=1 Tax=Aquimarina penaris TaxID=3231044 RepID=UPI00346345B8